jgi:hypothetical protein
MSMTSSARHRRPAETASGVEANERLTALTGTVLLAGFAVEGGTILALSRLLTLHIFLGMLLIGPVALKIASTGYRFIRYYCGSAPYVSKGPPAPLARLLGPFVILTSLAVLGSGVALTLAGPHRGSWLFLHKASFVLWFGVMTLHVLTYAWRLPGLLAGAPGRRVAAAITSGRIRWLLVGASLAGGLLIALLTVHWAMPWDTRLGGH